MQGTYSLEGIYCLKKPRRKEILRRRLSIIESVNARQSSEDRPEQVVILGQDECS